MSVLFTRRGEPPKLPEPDPVFNNNSWSMIHKTAAKGTAASYWSVGDRKAVTINGTVGVKSFSGTYYCFILGINHNTSVEGNNKIHIGFGASALTGGAYVAYCDSNYGSDTSTSCFNMNTYWTNIGGWNQCQMKTTICPQFKAALPSDLQSVIQSTTKWQNQGGGSSSGESSTNDIWLLSEMEIFGTASYSGYTANQAQYDFYKGVSAGATSKQAWAAASKIRYQDTSTSSACYWWERSAYSSDTGGFCIMGTDGGTGGYGAYRSFGFAPCLCL